MTKRTLCLQLATAVAVAWFNSIASAQTFQTVDDFALFPSLDSVVQGMTKDPFGNLYAAGYAVIDGGYHTVAMVRKSADGGATWQIVDAFSNGEAAPGFEYMAIASDAAGTLYAFGDNFWTDYNRWLVRRSTDGGATWTTVMNEVIPGAEGLAVSTDLQGNIYLAGRGSGSWMVRKSGDGGNSWTTVDVFSYPYGRASGILCHPTAGIFVAGSGSVTTTVKNKTTTQAYWYVRRSVNAGASWTTVDAYAGGGAHAVGADAFGNLYTAGGNSGHWIVRKSSNAGTTWATVDDFAPCVTISTKPPRSQCYTASATAFASDSVGNLFVVGTTRANYVSQWVVRGNISGSGWQTLDWFQYAPGHDSFAFGAVVDNAGSLFVGGFGNDASSAYGASHWLVRKSVTP